MTKIKFGFANEMNPNSSWQGIGIKDDLMLLEADYYGEIGYLDEDYIVAKVVEDEYNRFPELLDKFIIRPAVRRTYDDGSGVLLLNQEENEDIKRLNPDIKDASFSTRDLIHDNEILSTSIIPEAFKREVEKNRASKTM